MSKERRLSRIFAKDGKSVTLAVQCFPIILQHAVRDERAIQAVFHQSRELIYRIINTICFRGKIVAIQR